MELLLYNGHMKKNNLQVCVVSFQPVVVSQSSSSLSSIFIFCSHLISYAVELLGYIGCTNSRAHIASSLLAVCSFYCYYHGLLLLLNRQASICSRWLHNGSSISQRQRWRPAAAGRQHRHTHAPATLDRCTFTTNERIEKNLCWLGDFDCHCCKFCKSIRDVRYHSTKRFKFLLSFRSHSISFSPRAFNFIISFLSLKCWSFQRTQQSIAMYRLFSVRSNTRLPTISPAKI